jgi:xanthine dehydrogenase accessory factor
MHDLTETLKELVSLDEPACLAIVVAAEGGQARVGAKAVYDARGKRRGGDAGFSEELEARVGRAAVRSLETGEPELADVSDDACGARLRVYVEPVRAGGELVIFGKGAIADALARIGGACGFRVRTVASSFEPAATGAHVVVTTEHEADEAALRAALAGKPATVQLVSSSRRAPSVIASLERSGVTREKIALVRSPAGLDLGGKSPGEIALSIVSEIVMLRRGGSGLPLAAVKGTHKPKKLLEDTDELPLPKLVRHDEDFREPSDEKKVDRLLAEANDDFRPSRSTPEEDSFR